MKSKPILRGSAFVLTLIFAWTTLLGPAPVWAQTIGIGERGEIPDLEKNFPSLEIPSELGRVETLHHDPVQNGKLPFLFHLQDAHSQPEAQKKIHDLLKYLASQTKGRVLIALEGAEGEIHPEYLDLVPGERQINETVVEDLLAKGELSGAEKFAWSEYRLRHPEGRRPEGSRDPSATSSPQDDSKIRFVGVEDPELYRENLKTYRTLLFQQEEIETLLNPIQSGLERDQSRTFSPELRRFLRERTRRKEGNYGGGSASPQLAAYVDFLTAEARKRLGIDLTDPFEQLRFPQFIRLLVLGRLSKELNATRANEEKEKVLKTLRKKARTGEDKELLGLLESIESGRDPRALAEGAWEFAARYQIQLADYPEYLKGLGIVILEREMEPARLFEEMGQIEKLILEKLAARKEEKELLEKLEKFSLLEKLLRLELTREEYQSFVVSRQKAWRETPSAKRRGGPAALFGGRNDEGGLTGYAAQAMKFYQGAEARERVLLEKTLAALSQNENSPADLAILVTGGFHTAGLTEGLNERKINYAVLRPRFTAAPEDNLYAEVLRNKQAELPGSLHRALPSKQQALLLKSLLEQALPFLVEKLRLPHPQAAEKLADAVNHHPILNRSLEAVARTFSGHSTVRILVRSRIENSPAVSHGKASPPPHAIPDALLLGGAYETLRGEPTISDSVLGLEVTIDAAHRFRLTPAAVQKTQVGGMEVESGPIEALGPLPGRSEVRTETGRSELVRSDERLPWLESQGYQVVGELQPGPKRVISMSVDSELISVRPVIEGEESFAALSSSKEPPFFIRLSYVGLNKAKDPLDEDQRQTWGAIQRAGRMLKLLAPWQGVHSESELGVEPGAEKTTFLAPFPYVDPQISEIIGELDQIRYPGMRQELDLPVFRKHPNIKRLVEWLRKKRERGAGEGADFSDQLRGLVFVALFQEYLREQGLKFNSTKKHEQFRRLRRRVIPDAFVVSRYTSDYANVREFATFFEAIDRARKLPAFPSGRSVVVFTFLDRSKEYKGERLHDRIYRLLEGETVDNEKLQSAVNFYDFFDSADPIFPARDIPNAVYVINLKPKLKSPLFDRLLAYSDVAVGAGDQSLNLGIAISHTAAGSRGPVGPVFLLHPHPPSINGFLGEIESQPNRNFPVGEGLRDTALQALEAMRSHLHLQQPNLPLTLEKRANAVEAVAQLMVPGDKAKNHRYIFGQLVKHENMFNLILELVRKLEEGKAVTSKELVTPPPLIGPTLDLATDPPLTLQRHRLILSLHEATVGKGDARRIAQLAEVFRSAGVQGDDLLIHLADREVKNLEKGIQNLEDVLPDLQDFRFLYITKDPSGRSRYLVLEAPESEKRAEVRSTKAEAGIFETPTHDGLYHELKQRIERGELARGLPVLSIDYHSDANAPYWDPDYGKQRLYFGELGPVEEANWLAKAKKDGLVGKAFWLYPTQQMREEKTDFYAGVFDEGAFLNLETLDRFPSKEELPGPVIVTVDYDFFSSNSGRKHWFSDTEIQSAARQIVDTLTQKGIQVALLHFTPSLTYLNPDKEKGITPQAEAERIARLIRLEFERLVPSRAEVRKGDEKLRGQIRQSVKEGFDSFVQTVGGLRIQARKEGLPAGQFNQLLFEATRDDPDLRNRVSEYYGSLKAKKERTAEEEEAFKTVNFLGVGHLLSASPESRYAKAGGMADVLAELYPALVDAGASAAILSLAYGNKQQVEAFAEREGFEKLPEPLKIRIGPTKNSDTGQVAKSPYDLNAEIYRHRDAERDLEHVLLASPPQTDKLYPPNLSARENLELALLLSRGALEYARSVDLYPHFLISNDWTASFIPFYLRVNPDDTNYRNDPHFRGSLTLVDAHNLGTDYQMRPYSTEFRESIYPLLNVGSGEHYFGISDEPRDIHHLNLIKGGFFHADGILFKSPRYVLENLNGKSVSGLHQLLWERADRLAGISNGVDRETWRRSYQELGKSLTGKSGEYEKALLEYKRAAKALVQKQKEFGLEIEPDRPLFVMVARLAEQKGIELLIEGAEKILRQTDAQLAIFGAIPETSPEKPEARFRVAMERLAGKAEYKGQFVFHPKWVENPKLIFLAADFFLMPSKDEPGGIAQLQALLAGTGVVARNVGGLSSTVFPFNGKEGNGFVFNEFKTDAFVYAVVQAVNMFHQPGMREKIIQNAVRQDNSWERRVPHYIAFLQHLAGVLNYDYPHLREARELLKEIQPHLARSEVREDFAQVITQLMGNRLPQLARLVENYRKAGKTEREKIESEINQIIDQINLFETKGKEVEIAPPQYFVGKFRESRDYTYYRKEAEQRLLQGEYVPHFIFAGAAARLGRDLEKAIGRGLDPKDFRMYALDLWNLLRILQEAKDETQILELLKDDELRNLEKKEKEQGLTTEEAQRKAESLQRTQEMLRKLKDYRIPEYAGSLGMGPRQLIAYRDRLTELAAQSGQKPEDVLKKQRMVIHVNEEVAESVLKDFRENNFYGFEPARVFFIIQPVFPGYSLTSGGGLEVAPESSLKPYGHGYATSQLNRPWQSFRMDGAGEWQWLSTSILDYLKGQDPEERFVLGTHRVNDSTKFLVEEVVDLDRLALSLYLLDRSHYGVVIDLVANPGRQKGGSGMRFKGERYSFLLETLNAKGSRDLTQLINQAAAAQAPYNAFRLTTTPRIYSQLLDTGIPYNLGFDKGYFYLDSVTGNITQLGASRSTTIQKEGELIHDFKQLRNLLEDGLPFIERQDRQAYEKRSESRAEVRKIETEASQVAKAIENDIEAGKAIDFKEAYFDKVTDRRVFPQVKQKLGRYAERLKRPQSGIPEWKRLLRKAQLHAIFGLLNQRYVDLPGGLQETQVEEEMRRANQLHAQARNRALIEAKKIHSFDIPQDPKKLHEKILKVFGGGLRVRTYVAIPPGTGYEGSGILAAALMMALLRLRNDPFVSSLTVTSGLRFQTSSAGGSEIFAWAIRKGMTLVHGSFYLQGQPGVVVQVERLKGNRIEMESIDLNEKETVREETGKFEMPQDGFPLRYHKAAVALAASLPREQSTEPWSIAFLASVLEGLPQIAVYGGVNNIAAILGGIRFTSSKPGAYNPQSNPIENGKLIARLQQHARLFNPGLHKERVGEVSTAGRQMSRVERLLLNDQGILSLMMDLQTATGEMEDYLRKGDFKDLAIAMNNVQYWTNQAIDQKTPEPLNWFLEEVERRYQGETKKTLGVLVQGAGPIGGVLMVGEDAGILDTILENLIPEYLQRLKDLTLYDPENPPAVLPFEVTERPMTAYEKIGGMKFQGEQKAEVGKFLAQEGFALKDPAELLEEINQWYQTSGRPSEVSIEVSYNKELQEAIFALKPPGIQRSPGHFMFAPLEPVSPAPRVEIRSELREASSRGLSLGYREAITGIAREATAGIYAETEKLASRFGWEGQEALGFVKAGILEGTAYAEAESPDWSEKELELLGISREAVQRGTIPSELIVRFTKEPDLAAKAWGPLLRLLASEKRSRLILEVEGISDARAAELESSLHQLGERYGLSQASVVPVPIAGKLHAESRNLISSTGAGVGLVSARGELFDKVQHRRGFIRVDASRMERLEGVLAAAFLTALTLKNVPEEVYFPVSPEELAKAAGVEFGEFLIGYELLAEAQAQEYMATQA